MSLLVIVGPGQFSKWVIYFTSCSVALLHQSFGKSFYLIYFKSRPPLSFQDNSLEKSFGISFISMSHSRWEVEFCLYLSWESHRLIYYIPLFSSELVVHTTHCQKNDGFKVLCFLQLYECLKFATVWTSIFLGELYLCWLLVINN